MTTCNSMKDFSGPTDEELAVLDRISCRPWTVTSGAFGDWTARAEGESADGVPLWVVTSHARGCYTVEREIGWYRQIGDAEDGPASLLTLAAALDAADAALQLSLSLAAHRSACGAAPDRLAARLISTLGRKLLNRMYRGIDGREVTLKLPADWCAAKGGEQ